MMNKRFWFISVMMIFGPMFLFHGNPTKVQADLADQIAKADLADQIAKADVGYGEYLSGECVTCHRSTGASEGIPAINGIDAEIFVSIINAYRSKELENKVMQMMAGRLDDEQIISLAAYFSSLPD